MRVVVERSGSLDKDIAPAIRERNSTLQALLDAIALRQMLFSSIPQIREAKFRVYRQLDSQTRELIIIGLVYKDDSPPQVGSLVMRAKLYGLRFFDSGRGSGTVTSRC